MTAHGGQNLIPLARLDLDGGDDSVTTHDVLPRFSIDFEALEPGPVDFDAQTRALGHGHPAANVL
jgi:hypothetical protein